MRSLELLHEVAVVLVSEEVGFKCNAFQQR
jgi:hypothetical protein